MELSFPYFRVPNKTLFHVFCMLPGAAPIFEDNANSPHHSLLQSKYLTSLKNALKKGVASGALIRVRASYKVSKQWLQQEKAKERAKKKKIQAKAKVCNPSEYYFRAPLVSLSLYSFPIMCVKDLVP